MTYRLFAWLVAGWYDYCFIIGQDQTINQGGAK